MATKTARIKDDDKLLEPISSIESITPSLVIQSSPYAEHDHLLNVSTLDRPYALLATALQIFTPTTPRYAFEPYSDSFNFGSVVQALRLLCDQLSYDFPSIDVYIVAFRSRLFREHQQSSEKRQILADIDKASHAEANHSGGLLKYWFGIPDDATGQNLATCLWVSKDHARKGGGGPAHRQGMRRVSKWFEHWHIEQHILTISNNAKEFRISKYLE
uniref:ARAD1C22198p n=1 Tax=Blastobotrys adeninivorans TaxID=409370 RepID=A0A060T244_BLAAD